jgi:acetylornithine/N-succinyldiaminopimelate aminotransferase
MSTTSAAAVSPLLGVYRPAEPVFARGEGSWLIAEDGRRFLDFTSGIAVNALGYGDPRIAAAIRDAVDTGVIHTSNLFRTRPAEELAGWLVDRSFADRVFFCNSGAEANEGAIKFARRWARATGGAEKHEIVAFRKGFHGRTMGALATTDRADYQAPFRPLMGGVRFCDTGDVDGVRAAIRADRTAAVLIEPIQAEGGVLPVDPAFIALLRELCDDAGALLVFDEVQVGLGRTGKLWAHEHAGVAPDVMTLAKPLAGGLPMGAVLLTERVAAEIRPGDHATTFGGGPLVASVALAVCEAVGSPDLLRAVTELGRTLGDRLATFARGSERVRAVRGLGLIRGVELDGVTAAEVGARALDLGLLVCGAGPDVVRIVPPLTISAEELEHGVGLLEEAVAC